MYRFKSLNELLKPELGATKTSRLTAKGSACSQEMGKPQELSLILSGSDSGTTKNTKAMSATAITVATSTTRLSPYWADRYSPIAGLMTRLAAKVADTYREIEHSGR